MSEAAGEIVDLTVDRLAFGGRGVARHNGIAVFVKGGFPGDQVQARVVRKQERMWEAETVTVLKPSPHRIAAPCRHVGVCRGCALQELDGARQAAEKQTQVTDSLKRIGRIANPKVNPILRAAQPWRYRNKLEFAFGQDKNGLLIAGFYDGDEESGGVFDLQECLLGEPAFYKIMVAVRDALRMGKVAAMSAGGCARNLAIRRSAQDGSMVVNVITNGGLGTLPKQIVAAVQSVAPEVVGVVHTLRRGKTVSSQDHTTVWWGRDWIQDRVGKLDLVLPVTAFFQTNTAQATVLYAEARRLANLPANSILWDLYCGVGGIGLSLAGEVAQLVGVDQSSAGIRVARENAGQNEIENARFEIVNTQFERDDVLAWLNRQTPRPVQAPEPLWIVVDPPRAGLHPTAPKAIARQRPTGLVYVSCDPSTLARDAALLGELGYPLREVTPVDMFPQTAHIECVAVFVPAR